MSKPRRIVNLFGGPGTGKSIICAALFAELKFSSYNTEMVLEYAKDAAWEGRAVVLKTQEYVFGKQQFRVTRVIDSVDFVITDSPILMNLAYHDPTNIMHEAMQRVILTAHHAYESINILLTRTGKYQPEGRGQTYEEALEKDSQIKSILDSNSIPYHTLPVSRAAVPAIVSLMGREKWI